jgi:hypothetical protein
MTARGEFTRRSLLAAAAGAAAGGLVRPQGVFALARLGAMTQATPVLPAGPGQPPIIAREVWALGRSTPRVVPEYGSVELAFVHHTENPNGYLPTEVPGMLRSIFLFHRDVHGWNDIGYNFVVDRFGRIFEARAGGIDEPVIGAQAGGYNYRSTGIAVLGEYGAHRISPAARASLARLLAWKLALHGVPIVGRVTVRVNPTGAVYSRFPANARVSLPRVAGHRDADSTECPGNALYGELPELRALAARLQGHPALATLLVQATPSGQTVTGQTTPPGQAPPPGAAGVQVRTLTGRLAFLDTAGGVSIPGAPILIQARSVSHRGEVVQERTLAQAQTAADGSWSLPLYILSPAGSGVWLRALCPGATGVPAAVSEPVHVAGTVSFTPQATAPGVPGSAPPGAPSAPSAQPATR